MYQWFECQIHGIPELSHHVLLPKNAKLSQGNCDDSGVRTHSYECLSHIKYGRRIINVWSGSGMSLKWMRGPYHYITVWYMSNVKNLHSHLQTWPSYCDDSGVRTLSYDCPPHIKPFIFMTWIQYEYVVDERSQSYPTACPQWESHTESYNPAHPF